MKNIIIVGLMFVVSLLTVATAANAEPAAENAEQVNLVIYRPNDRSALNYRVWVDGQYLGKLERGEVLKLHLSAGEHLIRANDSKRSHLTVMLGGQKVTYVRSEISRNTELSLTEVPVESMAGL